MLESTFTKKCYAVRTKSLTAQKRTPFINSAMTS